MSSNQNVVPGVVLVSKFTNSSSKKFSNYIEYIDREEAKRNERFKDYNIHSYDGYQQYMENPEKSTGLFTMNNDFLSEKEKKYLKEQYIEAQKLGSPMWQDVFSFDNKWLKEQGIYDPKTKYLDERRIRDAIRVSMNEMFRLEGMQTTGIWSASIHFNTDNIHVHVASVEVPPTRKKMMYKGKEVYRAKRTKKVIDRMRSKFSNHLLDRDRELALISSLIREQLTKSTERKPVYRDKELVRQMIQVMKKLPSDKRMWKYNHPSMKSARPYLDKISAAYLKKYKQKELSLLDKKLTEEMKFREGIYGTGEKEFERYKDYKENKMKELYANMGNRILQEIKIIDKHQKLNKSNTLKMKRNYMPGENRNSFSLFHVHKLKRSLGKDVQDFYNQIEYERLEREQEQKRMQEQQQYYDREF